MRLEQAKSALIFLDKKQRYVKENLKRSVDLHDKIFIELQKQPSDQYETKIKKVEKQIDRYERQQDFNQHLRYVLRAAVAQLNRSQRWVATHHLNTASKYSDETPSQTLQDLLNGKLNTYLNIE